MEKIKWKAFSSRYIDNYVYIGTVLMFLLQIFLLFTPAREEKIRTAYLSPLIVAMIVYIFMRIGLPYTPTLLLSLAFAFWYLLTRIINGDWYLLESNPYVYMILLSCCVLFYIPFMANNEQRGKLLKGISWVFVISFSVIAWMAVISALVGKPWVNPLDSNNVLGINEVYANPYRLNILGVHPNISAIFFYTSLSLLFYLFFHSKRLWARIGYIVPGLGLYLAICMTGSISAIVVIGVIIGLVVFALIIQSIKIIRIRTLIAILGMLVSASIVVMTYPLIIEWTANIYEKVQRQRIAEVDPSQVTLLDDEEAQPVELAAAINTLGNAETTAAVFAEERLEVTTMTNNMHGRFKIYSSAYFSIKERPITLLIGELWQDAMDRSAKVINIPYQYHLHNSFLQILVVGGGISFLIALAFTILLVIHGIRLFLNRSVPLYLKMLVLTPVGLLCHSMTESILFIDTRLPNMLFFLLAGMIIVYSKEYCSSKHSQE